VETLSKKKGYYYSNFGFRDLLAFFLGTAWSNVKERKNFWVTELLKKTMQCTNFVFPKNHLCAVRVTAYLQSIHHVWDKVTGDFSTHAYEGVEV